MRKRLLSFVILFIFSILQLSPLKVVAVENLPTRIINVVYDDSGSMIRTDPQHLVDTWCQAKYSMEVFAAMLGERDTMNIYVMSDYDKGQTSAPPRLSLSGSSGSEANVAKVHNMITAAGNTPFNAVRKAYSDLSVANADEKWLVILTDGEFEDGAFSNQQVDAFLGDKAEDVGVMFLGMGESAAAITANESQNIYFEKAQDNKQILNKITEICTRIFNSNKLPVNVANGEFSFDLPMSEIVVFAQGDNVKINGITDGNGNQLSPDKQPVNVRYSEKPSSVGYTNFIVDDKLNGSIATFRGDLTPGFYTANVESAETIEVYYKPNVEIMLYLVDENGAEVPYTDGVRSGEYSVQFGFVKAGTDEKLAQSSLLGEVRYEGEISYNGEPPMSCTNGSHITIEEGRYHIGATAQYLKYNTVSGEMDFEVFRDKSLEIVNTASPEYTIDNEGIVNANEPMTFHVTLEGTEIDPVTWQNFPNATFTQTGRKDNRVDFTVEKTDEPGTYNVYPSLTTDKPIIGDYGDIDYQFSVAHMENKSTWSGEYNGTYTSTDTRSWFVRHADKFIKLLILGIVALLILGYVPPFKKYLPKKLKKMPRIDCESKVGMHKTWTANGKFTKNRMSTIIPYRAERGSIKYLPRGVSGGTALSVKAIGSNKMEITNTKSFMGKDNITFNGSSVQKGAKKNLSVTAGLRVKVENNDAIYTCVLNK